ncbi:MAG: ABC transporter ATP-binding protein/permease [Lachnospiraceae bacterium]|nr:ABC transporter ATP-binding protein/permease [Lachnospiraceae bacterium]
MKKILNKIFILLDKKQKRFMIVLVIMMLIGAILEACSVAVIIPVINIIIDKDAIESSRIMSRVFELSHISDVKVFAVLVMVLLILMFVIKNIYLYIQQKVLYNYIYTNQFSTSERMMRNYIRRNYEYFLTADTAVIQRTITSDVNNMYALILSLLTLVSEVIVFIALAVFLLFTDWRMTVFVATLLAVTLLVIKIVIKPMMYKAGKDNQDYYSSLFKWINESVTGIKDIKIGGRERFFVNEYIRYGTGYVDAVQKYTLYSNVPRLIIEVVCISGMVLYFIFLYLTGQNSEAILSVLGAVGVALARLMPCANRINNQLNNIAYFEPFLMGVSDNLQDEISGANTDLSVIDIPKEKLEIKEGIELKNICYKYPETSKYILEDASIEVKVGEAIGIVGTTGAGKSTIVDVMLGLLHPEKGQVLADGKDVLTEENYRKYLKNIGYIPQNIFMLDDTIKHNIAFGVPDDEIDENRLWEVIKEAQLEDFIKGREDGLDANIGERGIQISGGQRQRIGIARALYDDPEVLVLDEATSALDGETEKAVMESINILHGKKTLVIIAHRLQTIEKCDHVYRIENGVATKER